MSERATAASDPQNSILNDAAVSLRLKQAVSVIRNLPLPISPTLRIREFKRMICGLVGTKIIGSVPSFHELSSKKQFLQGKDFADSQTWNASLFIPVPATSHYLSSDPNTHQSLKEPAG